MKKLIDLHCDTLSRLTEVQEDVNLQKNTFCVDVEKLKKAGSAVQFFACFIYVKDREWDGGFENALRMIERMRREEVQCQDLLTVQSWKEIKEQEKNGKISAFLTLEEGGVLNGSLSRLETLYEKGIRLITLTWNYENCLGWPNSRDPEVMQKGLKEFGKKTVEHMNDLGMIVDVSHLSDGGFWDCIRLSKKPVVASHSNARTLCQNPRNLTDEMIRALGETGGVAGLNFYPAFLREAAEADITDIARHALHMIRTGGEESVAIGTDFDGFDMPVVPWIRNIAEVDLVWESMKKYGITERQLDKIWYENAARVLESIL